MTVDAALVTIDFALRHAARRRRRRGRDRRPRARSLRVDRGRDAMAAPARYGTTAIALHWAARAADRGDLRRRPLHARPAALAARLRLFNWHKWAGVTSCCCRRCASAGASRTGRRPTCRRPPGSGARRTRPTRCCTGCRSRCRSRLGLQRGRRLSVVWFGVLPLPDFAPVNRALAAGLKTAAPGPRVHARRRRAAARGRRAQAPLRRPRRRCCAACCHETIADRRCRPARLCAAGGRADAAARPERHRVHDAPDGRAGRRPLHALDGTLALDPKRPEAGSVALLIDASSARFGAPETDAEVVKPAWLATAKFPQASFESTSIRAAGGGRYEVAGRLTIKGSTRDVVVPVQLAQAGGSGAASGSFTIRRLDFKIGEGEWADTGLVADDVVVRFRFALAGLAPP